MTVLTIGSSRIVEGGEMNHSNQVDNKSREIFETVNFYRGLILDLIEQELSESKNWSYVRSRLLKALGDKGLEGRLRSILEGCSQNS